MDEFISSLSSSNLIKIFGQFNEVNYPNHNTDISEEEMKYTLLLFLQSTLDDPLDKERGPKLMSIIEGNNHETFTKTIANDQFYYVPLYSFVN
jgi:hypothetical protein